MTTIGFIGSGNIGGTVAQLAVAAGYDVVVSNSRGPDTLAGLVADLGPKARAATATEAAGAADIVVVSVPLKAYRAVPVAALAGKVVLDTNNYYPQRDGQIASLDEKKSTTAGLLQEHLPSSHVVKVFNNIYFKHLGTQARPAGDPDRSTLAIAGDDGMAKKTATDFLDAIGYNAYDTGSLAESWRFERDTPAYTQSYYSEDGDMTQFETADPSKIQRLLDEAVR